MSAGRAIALCLSLAACGAAERRGPGAALAFLIAQQSAQGAFVADGYGVLRAGRSSTALAALALARWPNRDAAQQAALRRALTWLDQRGLVPAADEPIDYPCYTAALTALAAHQSQLDEFAPLVQRAVALLRDRQLGRARGWTPEDPEFGGFGFGVATGPRPAEGDVVSLSVTAWAIEALTTCGAAADDPCLRAALQFVQRCQIHDPQDPARHGGCVHSPRAGITQSKAGSSPRGPLPYATTTADAWRALRALGDHDAAAVAQAWLARHLTPPQVAGFAAASPQARPYEPALRLYAAAALAPQLALWPTRADAWRQAWRDALRAQQRGDGAVVGWSPLLKEDEPLIATALALLAWPHLGDT